MRWARNSSSRMMPSPLCSAQAADDRRTDQVRHRQGQPLPGGNDLLEFRIERVVIRDRGAWGKAEVVGRGSRLEAPVVFEGERAGAPLAAPEIKQAATA